jgi:hypothetical protein
MALNSPKVYRGLAVFQAADAVAAALRLAPVTAALDAVNLAPRWRPVLPVVNGLSAVGLASAGRFPALTRLTTFMLTVYFVLAVAFHVRARDWGPGLPAAASFLGLYAILTAKGPAERPN